MRNEDEYGYWDQERIHAVVDRHLTRRHELKSASAQHHLYGGFNRRSIMLDTGRRVIDEITHSSPSQSISHYEATDLAIQLNALYMNICGALDNLAWAMQYEWDIIPGVTETTKRRTQIGLYGQNFLKALSACRPKLYDKLIKHEDWYKELRDLRDPAAHRVPLYAVPGVMTKAVAAEYKEMQEAAAELGRGGDHDGMMELIYKSTKLGSYQPLMSIWTPEGDRLMNAWTTVLRDLRQFEVVASLISVELLPAPVAG